MKGVQKIEILIKIAVQQYVHIKNAARGSWKNKSKDRNAWLEMWWCHLQKIHILYCIKCIPYCACIRMSAIQFRSELKHIEYVMHVLLWCVVVISTKNNNYKIIWMPAPVHSISFVLHVMPWSFPLLDKFFFFLFHINQQPSYSTNLINPSPRREKKILKIIIIYAQSFVVTSEIGLKKKQNIQIFTRHEFVMRRALPHYSKCTVFSTIKPIQIQIQKKEKLSTFFRYHLFHSIFIISISIAFFCAAIKSSFSFMSCFLFVFIGNKY